jgi:hypothetical protein
VLPKYLSTKISYRSIRKNFTLDKRAVVLFF